MCQSGHCQRAAEAVPLFRRVNSDDVDLAYRVVGVRSVVIGGGVMSVVEARAVHLGPVKTDQTRRATISPLGEQEACRVEPVLTHADGEVMRRPLPLVRVIGEGPGIEVKPCRFVAPRFEGSDSDSAGQSDLRQRSQQ